MAELALNRMILIGSTGPNSGKTVLACSLIERFKKTSPIVAVKVTTVKERNGRCPRGGAGCGVCSSLDGDFAITEETNPNSHKDTSRLLASGAHRVLWLRVMKDRIKEAVKAMLAVLPPGLPIVCESNSLRGVLKPGVFIMIAGGGSMLRKVTARRVIRHADRVVRSAGGRVGFDIDQVSLENGGWAIVPRATAVILAGGSSSRMGQDKAMMPVECGPAANKTSRPMVEVILGQLGGLFTEVVISANEAARFRYLDLRVVPDRVRQQGPMMAIASAVGASKTDINFVTACDIPQLDKDLVKRMLRQAKSDNVDIVVPVNAAGRYETLFAVYKKSCLPAVDEALEEGVRKISDVFCRCRVRYVSLEDSARIVNINTPRDRRRMTDKTIADA
jgi:molybdopterin-guanine dinucleotide biosynthesis protein A